MDIVVTIPDTLVEQTPPDAATARRVVLEEAVAALYRAGKITKTHVMTWLELADREDFYTFLHTHHIPMTTLDVLQHDRATSERLGL